MGLVEVFLVIIRELFIRVFIDEVILDYINLMELNFFVLILIR